MKWYFAVPLLVMLLASTAVAAPLFSSMAIEFRENGRFLGVIGKAYVTDETISIVALAELEGRIVPSPYVYSITEKTGDGDGLVHVKCRGQVPVVVTGTVDLRDRQKPRIVLKTDQGIVITNLTEEGLAMKNKYLPAMDLGR